MGKFISVQEGEFSDQFFSASMDGTIKLWDLKSKPMPRIIKKSKTNTSFEHPEKLNNYKSPLSIYNNRLKPSYTVRTIIVFKQQFIISKYNTSCLSILNCKSYKIWTEVFIAFVDIN